MSVLAHKEDVNTSIRPRMMNTDELEREVKILNVLKQTAYDEGICNRVLLPKSVPENFPKGYIAEIGMAALLGRIGEYYYENYNIILEPSFDFSYDLKRKCDVRLNNMEINIKSQKTIQFRAEVYKNQAIVYYDKPGIFNLFSLLSVTNLLKPISDNTVIEDINYLWEMYMTLFIRIDTSIVHKGYEGAKLNNYKLYLTDFPNLLSVEKNNTRSMCANDQLIEFKSKHSTRC